MAVTVRLKGVPAVMVLPTDETSWSGLANTMMALAALMSVCAWAFVSMGGTEVANWFTWLMKAFMLLTPVVGLPEAKLAAAALSFDIRELPLPLLKAPIL